MEKKKRLGRGLKEISHYFISSDRNIKTKEEQSDSQKEEACPACHVVSVIDLFNPGRAALLTTKICQSLCKNGLRTLAIDVEERFPGVAFTLGCSIPGYLFSHFLTDSCKPDDLIYMLPSGLNILEPRLNIDDMQKMNTEDISSMLDILSAIESNTDVIVMRGYDHRITPLIRDALFVIEGGEKGHTPLINAYNVIKSFIACSVNTEITDIGIVVTGAAGETEASSIYERIKKCSELYTSITPFYYGYLPVIDNTTSASPITSNIIERLKTKTQKDKRPIHFFEKLKTLVIKDYITQGELAALSQ